MIGEPTLAKRSPVAALRPLRPGRARPAVAPDAPADVGTAPDAIGATLCRAARKELDAAGVLLAARGPRLHRGVHLGRKCLRRVRAALALGGPALGRGARLIDRELRRILHELSDLRDGQALVEVLQRGAARLPAEHAPLLARAGRAACARRADLARAAGGSAASREQREMLAILRATLAGLPWARIDAEVARDGLFASEHAVADAAARVRADPDDDGAWHRWRRRARRQSQQHRLIAGTVLAVDREYEKAFAETLGAAQDLSLLLAHCGRDSPFTREDRRMLAQLAREAMHLERARMLAQVDAGPRS